MEDKEELEELEEEEEEMVKEEEESALTKAQRRLKRKTKTEVDILKSGKFNAKEILETNY